MMTGQRAYQAFEAQNDLPIFFQSWYLDLIYGKDNWTCSAHFEDDQLLAIWIYSLSKAGPFQYVALPTLIKYTGIIFADHVKDEEYGSIYQSIIQKLPKTASWIQQFQVDYHTSIAVEEDRFSKESRKTFYLDITNGKDFLLSKMDGNYRRAINKFLPQLSDNTRRSATDQDIESFVELLEESMGSIDKHSLSKLALSNLIKESEARNQGKLLLLYNELELISGAFILWDNEKAYYLLAGNLSKARKMYPGVLTAYLAANFCMEKNIQILDFLGSDIDSIARIWRKLGAMKQEYTLLKSERSWFVFLKKIIGK